MYYPNWYFCKSPEKGTNMINRTVLDDYPQIVPYQISITHDKWGAIKHVSIQALDYIRSKRECTLPFLVNATKRKTCFSQRSLLNINWKKLIFKDLSDLLIIFQKIFYICQEITTVIGEPRYCGFFKLFREFLQSHILSLRKTW